MPYSPITHAEQARASQKGACSFTFTKSNCSREADTRDFYVAFAVSCRHNIEYRRLQANVGE
jgi:hypothetical protein